LGSRGGAQARETRDVGGLAVAPGFINMMGQSEINALIDNRVFSKITQGITTEVTGEGGSVAPLTDQLVLDDSDAMKKWHYREDWRDLDGYFAQLAKQGAALNIATFVGATQVRLAVVGEANRAATAAEHGRAPAAPLSRPDGSGSSRGAPRSGPPVPLHARGHGARRVDSVVGRERWLGLAARAAARAGAPCPAPRRDGQAQGDGELLL